MIESLILLLFFFFFFSDIKKEEIEIQTIRSLTTEFGCLTRQDGSASLSQGDTSTLCVAYGPTEVRITKELIDKATVEVVYKPKIGLPRPKERKWERVIRNSLEPAIMTNLHPRSSITIVVQETEDMGSKLACMINAACLALLDAAVNLNYMVAAIAVSIDESGQVFVDPTKRVEDGGKANMTLVFDSCDMNIVTAVSSGQFSCEEYQQCVTLAKDAASTVFKFYRDSFSQKLLKSI